MYREEEYLPESVRKYYDLEPVDKALKEVHFPTGTENLMEAKKRIIFDEFFRFFECVRTCKRQGRASAQSLYYPYGRTGEKIYRKPAISAHRKHRKKY